MKKIILTILFTSLLFADNPLIYSALGDVIYDNAKKINNLKNINQYASEINKIDKYIDEVKKTKKDGYSILSGDKTISKMGYLNKLRKLSKTNDYFIRSAKLYFKQSISKEDNYLFSKIINSGLIDTDKCKEQITNYYFSHSNDINSSGIIQSYLDNDKKLRVKKEAQRKLYMNKKMREEARIKRIRQDDLQKQKELEKRLDDEVKAKKLQIRKEQNRELFN